MKITAVYASPFADITKRETEHIALPGGTLDSLITVLGKRYGPSFREALLDADGADFYPGMVVLVSGRRGTLATELAEGDEVAFLMAMAGG